MKTIKLPIQFMPQTAEIVPLKHSDKAIYVAEISPDGLRKTNTIVPNAKDPHRYRRKGVRFFLTITSLVIFVGWLTNVDAGDTPDTHNTLREFHTAADILLTNHAGLMTNESPSTADIFRKVQETYSSLRSYSDQGYVKTGDGKLYCTFAMRFARPNNYLIEWTHQGGSASDTRYPAVQAAWSSGAGNFLKTEFNSARRMDLSHAANSFDGLRAIVSQLFFKISSIGQEQELDDLALNEKRLADEIVGNLSCYVFEQASQGRTNTLWIGKRDFLIHQVRTEVSAKAMRTALVRYIDPEMCRTIQGFTWTEIHTNIVLNEALSRRDFTPPFPVFFEDE